jgi:hypothetical protein
MWDFGEMIFLCGFLVTTTLHVLRLWMQKMTPTYFEILEEEDEFFLGRGACE